MNNNQEITIEEVGKKLNEGFDQMDDAKVKGLESVGRIQNTKAKLKQREVERLEKKYGSKSPQVIKTSAKVRYQKIASVAVKEQALLAAVKTPPLEANAWRFQGRVVDTKNQGLSGLTVSLFDEKGNWIRPLGQACTDENGFFAITYKQEKLDEKANASRSARPLIPTVSDNTQTVLHQEKEPVFLKLGRIDSRLIIIGGERCNIPPDNINNNDGKDGDDSGNDNNGNNGGDNDEDIEIIDTADVEKGWMVKGVVRDAKTKEVLKGMKVCLFDKDLFFDDDLGTTTTDENGAFEFKYQEKDFKDLFDKKPDLYLKVLDKQGNTLYTSRNKIRCEANKEEFFDVSILKKR